jgi:hypothetical protein
LIKNFRIKGFNSEENIKKKLISILVYVFLILILTLIIVFSLVTKDDYKGKFNNENFSKLARKIILTSALNQEITLKNVEINSILNSLLISKIKDMHFKGLALKGVNIISANKDVALIYLPLTFNKIHIGAEIEAKIFLSEKSEQIIVDVKKVKFGKLRVFKFIFFLLLKESLKEGLKIKDNKLFLPSNMKLEVYGSKIDFKIEKLNFCKSDIELKIKIIKESLKNFALDKIKELFKGNS